jgi:hypothetical protein
MDYPNTKAVYLTEKIMAIFWQSNTRPLCVPKLETEAYNRVFEHVLRVLREGLGDPKSAGGHHGLP